MKKIFIFIFGILLFLSFVHAEEISTLEDKLEAGTTPDSPLYGIDLALERIGELFSENIKLLHAKERLAEVKVMINQNKLEHAEKARLKFEELRLRVKNQTKIEEHKKLIDNLGQKISAIASIKGQLTEQQRLDIKMLIEQHKERIKTETVEIINKTRGYRVR